jgi:glyoxylate reductase
MPRPERIFVTRAIPASAIERMRRALPGADIAVGGAEVLPPAELAARASGADALVCTLADRIDRALLEALAPRLRVVVTFAVGYENIDLDAARALGVRVAHTPGVLTDATAEVAVALLLACARRVAEGDRVVRAGGFRGWDPLGYLGHAVYGKTCGIVGAGRIGLRVPRSRPEWEEALSARFVSKDELLAASDFVSIHCPLVPATRHLIDAAALSRMRRSACLVNTARGPIVDEAALVRALREGRIAAAGLDVYEREPELAAGLAALDNVVLLPHLGSATHEARDAMGRLCADAVIAVLSGGEPAHALV